MRLMTTPSRSTDTRDQDHDSDNLSILRRERAELDEALSRCERRLANMEGEFLRRRPNTLTTTIYQVIYGTDDHPLLDLGLVA